MKPISVNGEIYNFINLEKIGEGTYGVVYKAFDVNNKTDVALKKVRFDTRHDGVPSTSIREISMLREISHHPNLIKLINTLYTDSGKLYLVFEYMTMDLRRYMDRVKAPIDCQLIKSYMYQICRAISFCHSRRIVHRDLKPQNLLIDLYGIIKIADFGLARAVGIPLRVYTHEIVTLWYRAPEVLLGQERYDEQIDVWSVGCIFAEMFTKRPLFRGDSEIDQLFTIFKILGTPTEKDWPALPTLPEYKCTFPKWSGVNLQQYLTRISVEAHDLLMKMILYNSDNRIAAIDALKHPYFIDFDSKLLPPSPSPYKVANFDDDVFENPRHPSVYTHPILK